jgi:RecA-family ATPase
MTADLRKIAKAMNGEVAGNVASFPTPGHGPKDRGSWATIVPDAPDGVLIHSSNGGDPLAIKDELRAKGVLPEREISTRQRRDVAAWDYTDADGVVLYRKVRVALPDGGKSYRFEHPDGRGGWKPKRGDAQPVPYRLHELAHAPRETLLYMAEGEKQADKLASWGLLATSSKDWRSFDFSGYVRGRTVVILPDNDEEGTRVAEAAREAVEKAGGEAITLSLPGLPPKGDVMDWSGTADDLRALVDAAVDRPPETFEVADLVLWASTAPTPKAFLMPPFIPRDDVVIVTGDGGTNKSTAALQISVAAAAGKQMLGMDVSPGPALYVTAEDDQRENHWRLAKIASALGTSLHDLAGKLHIVSLRGRLNNELATFDQDGKLRTAPAYALLRATIEATKAKLVTLDNVAHLFAGNENDRTQVTAFINLLYQLCNDFGATILLIAHRPKSDATYSGSTAWLNAVRSQVLLERSDENDADVRRMTLGKANYARAGEEVTFRWHDFALIRNDDLPASVGAELAANIQASADNAIFLRCLAERNRQRRQVSEKPTAANYAPKHFEMMAEAKGLKRARLEKAMDRLFRTSAIERGFLYRDTGEGKDIYGLRQATGEEPESSPESYRKHLPEGTGDPQESTGNTPPIYKYIPGAATEAAAPVLQEEKADLSRVVFPAGEVDEVRRLLDTPSDDWEGDE